MLDLTDFWKIPDKNSGKTDCFIVLSYALKSKFIPTNPTRVLIEKAKELTTIFPGTKVIMSTGDNQYLGVTNASVMAEYGKRIGIPAKFILEEGVSKTTVENLLYSKKIMEKNGLKNPTLICFDLHTRRAVAIAGKSGWKNFNWISVFGRGEPAYGYKYLQTFSRLTILLYEILAFIYSVIKGEIDFPKKYKLSI